MQLVTNNNLKSNIPILQTKVAKRPSFVLPTQPPHDEITFGNENVKLQQKLIATLRKSGKAYPPSTTVADITTITILQKKFGGLISKPIKALLAKTQESYNGKTYEGLAVFSNEGTLLGTIKHLDAEEWKGYEAEKRFDTPDRFREGKYLRLHNLNASYTDKYKGIGTALIQAAIEESKKLGFEGQLKVHAENYTDLKRGCPIPFYAKMGFIPASSPLTKEELIAEYSKPENTEAAMKMFLLTPERATKLRAQNISFGSASAKQIKKCKKALIKSSDDYNASTRLENFKDITLLKKQTDGSAPKPVEAFLTKVKTSNSEGLAVFSQECELLGHIQCLDAEEWETTDEDIGKYLRLHGLDASYSDKYNGVGTALINAAKEESQNLGLDGQLKVYAYNTFDRTKGCPIPFYAKMGFVPGSFYPSMSKVQLIDEYSKSYHSNSAMKMLLVNPMLKKPQETLPQNPINKSFLAKVLNIFR